MKRLIWIFLGFGALALLAFAIQYSPWTGFIAMMLGGPLWIGGLLHLMLAVIFFMAVFAQLPRWALTVPLVFWIAGLALWWTGMRASDAAVLARPDAIAAGEAPLIVRNDMALARALAGYYRTGPVYSDLHRHTLARGEACTPLARHDPNRILWTPPEFVARGECLWSQRMEPPARGIEIAVVRSAKRHTSTGGEIVPIDISDRRTSDAPTRRLEFGFEQVPAPLLFPILGIIFRDSDGARVLLAELWRITYPMASAGVIPGPDEAPYAATVAAALGLERRPRS
jgi:hypothetical protein